MEILRAESTYTNFDKVAELFFDYYKYLETLNVKLKIAQGGEILWLESVKRSLNKTSILVVIENKGLVVGFGYGQIKLAPEYLGSLKLGIVSHFYLDEKMRGGEASQKMFAEMKKWFVEKKVHSIELQVVPENTIGLNFWRKLGFEIELNQMRLKA